MESKPFRVLSLDGGGMRGIYTAKYLFDLTDTYAKRRQVHGLDLGKGFDLVVGTSTGAIIGAAVAAGVGLDTVMELYKEAGPRVFNRRLPQWKIGYVSDLANRGNSNRLGAEALKSELSKVFGDLTLGKVYQSRGIALAIPAVELGQHRAWVFKTPHSPRTNHRDDDYTIVDVCLATSAAPIYRSLAAIDRPNDADGFNVFADGGLWANNPVLIGLLEALEMAQADQPIEIFCLGTCPRPEGEQIEKSDVHRGILEWKGGGLAAALSIDAQEFAFDHMARLLSGHVKNDSTVVRFPSGKAPASILKHLELDDTSTNAMRALSDQAHSDANMTNSACNDPNSSEGARIHKLFMDIPELITDGVTDV